MNITVNEDRTVEKKYTENEGSQNENRITELTFTLPEAYTDFVHKIVFITEDGNYTDYIENNTYILKNNVTKYRKVKSYVWLTETSTNKDFRSELFELEFNYNEDPSDYIPTEEEKSQIEALIDQLDELIEEVESLPSMHREIVEELPTTDIDPSVIYMILREDSEPNNIYDEWLYVNDAWEKIGSTETDLSDYYTKEESDEITDELSEKTDDLENKLDIAKKDINEIDNILYGREELESTNSEISFTGNENLEFSITEIDGKTKQNSYEGYNLLEPSFESFSNNNVTITDNHNGTYTFNGTASADTVFVFKRNWQLENNTQYRVSGCPSGGSANTYYIYGTNMATMDRDVGSGSVATTGTSTITLAIMIKSGVNTNGLIFKPMVVLGTTAKTFEPYTGGIASPNPSYPQEIEVVRGKNRFDGELLPNSYNPTTGEIEASGTSYRSNKIPLQKNETYYLSGITGNVRVLYWNNTSYVSSEVITMPNSFITKGNIIAFQFDKSLSHENIMIEKGSTATSYLPYNTIEVKIQNGNLLPNYRPSTQTLNGVTLTNNGDGTLKLNGTASAYTQFVDSDSFDLEAGTYTLYERNTSYSGVTAQLRSPDGLTTYTQTNTIAVFTLTEKTSVRFRMVLTSGTVINNVDVTPMILKGNVSSNIPTYVEHQEQIKQLSLGEYEFAKIGNYVDTIEYDVDEDKVYKNEVINKYQFTGNEIFGKSSSTTLNGYIFNFSSVTTNILVPANNGTKANILSNAFITKAVDTIIGEATYGIGIRSDRGIYIGAPLGSFENVSALQTYLANNITFMYYTLITPVKKEITGTLADQIKALYRLQQKMGTTIVEILGDLSPEFKIVYETDTISYIKDNFVKNTDYATSMVGGVVRVANGYGIEVSNIGQIRARVNTYANYQSADVSSFVGKGTLDNVLNAVIGDINSLLDEINGEII